jgi:hypothetical protein
VRLGDRVAFDMSRALDLGPRARRVFAAAYGVVLGAAVAYGQLAPDHVFGFQMFNESSNLEIGLFREVVRDGVAELLPLPDGGWDAPDDAGSTHHFSWNDRVRSGPIQTLGVAVHASYGLDAQLFRLEHALRDVVSNIALDRETRALVAVVATVKNGRPAGTVRLRAARP